MTDEEKVKEVKSAKWNEIGKIDGNRRQRIDWKEVGGGKSLITDMCEKQIDKNQKKEHTWKSLNALNH